MALQEIQNVPTGVKTIKGVQRTRNDEISVEFQLGKMLGKGAFAQCFELRSTDGKMLAGKVISKESMVKATSKQKLVTEIKNHRSLGKHPNIVQFVNYFENEESYYIVLELCNHRTMRSLLRRRKKLTEPEVRYYLKQIIGGLKYVHSHGIVHRDLKLENIFIKNMQVKLGDFGLSANIKDLVDKKTICGTPNYLAPEILKSQGHGYPMDIWAIGIITYSLIIGNTPFESDEVENTYNRIKGNDYHFPLNSEISEEAKDFIKKILNPDPHQRPSLDEISSHSFLALYTPKVIPDFSLVTSPSESDLQKHEEAHIKKSRLNTNIQQQQQQQQHQLKHQLQQQLQQQLIQQQQQQSPSRLTKKINIDLAPSQQKLKLKPEQQQQQQQQDTPSKLKRKVNNELSPQQEIDKSPSKKSRIETNSELSSLYYLLEKVVSIDPTSEPAVKNNIDTFDDQKCRNIVWVMKWIDYSAKFGLGYTLCNNTSGVVFNDNSKIVMSNEGRIDYFEPVDGNNRKNEMKSFLNVTNLAELINNTADKFIHKRLVLLQNFHTYLNSCKPSNGLDTEVNLICDNPIYIRHWLRTENSILFYLSNSTIQINFFDHSKILLSDCHNGINSENNNVVLTFVKDGVRRTNFLSYAVSSPQHAQESMGVSLDDLLSRLRYLKDCIRLID